MTSSHAFGVGCSVRPLEPDEQDNLILDLTYDWALFEIKDEDETVAYDSDAPPAEVHPAARGFAAHEGQKLRIKIAPDGEVLEKEGVDELARSIRKAMPDHQAPEATAEYSGRADWVHRIAVERLLMTFDRSGAPAAAQVGESWSGETEVGSAIPFAIQMEYTLQSIEDDTYAVSVAGTQKPSDDSPPLQAGNASLEMEFPVKLEGTNEFDRRSGWPLRGTFSGTVKGKAKVVIDHPDGPAEITWPVRMETLAGLEGSIKDASEDTPTDPE